MNNLITAQIFDDWAKRELEDEIILQELKELKINESEATEILSSYKKAKLEKRQTYGFIAAGVGAFFCMTSCFLTLLGVLPELRSIILYGLTSIGICVIVLGLYLIFED